MNLNQRWYSANSPTTSLPGNSLQNTDEEDNAQPVADDEYTVEYVNWAGNCGDATSYFWFEKIACGSTRTFHTDRSLIEDFVQLTPTWEDIQQILDLYYTTKAPLAGRENNVGFTFITADYHIPPVLPPKINCTCHAAMDAYASLLSVVSKTPTPGAPITLDPEVLNTGTSKIVATLRMYQDPTYSIPASSVAAMPIVVTRFYLEVSTKFTRNRITISDCQASNLEYLLNDTTSLKPRMNYCDNSTFDTKTERSPNGVTHMDRISMKKFKFQTTTDVFVQCKIRACAQQPCGICTGTGHHYRGLQDDVDLSPAEGEMFSPPVNIKVSRNDPNALTFPDTVADFRAKQNTIQTSAMGAASAAGPGRAASNKPFQVSSNLILSTMTAAWATQNKAAVAGSLRKVLELTPEEELVITAIKSMGMGQSTGAGMGGRQRQLQVGGVKIDFILGLNDATAANVAKGMVSRLASGSPSMVLAFSATLDQELIAAGQPAVNMPATAMQFTPPTVRDGQSRYQGQSLGSGGFGWEADTVGGSSASKDDDEEVVEEDGNTGVILGVIIGCFVMGFMALGMWMMRSKQPAEHWGEDQGQHWGPKHGHGEEWGHEGHGHHGPPDMYASKVAALDNQWSHEQQHYPQQYHEEEHYDHHNAQW
jgi:hypothetical protein